MKTPRVGMQVIVDNGEARAHIKMPLMLVNGIFDQLSLSGLT